MSNNQPAHQQESQNNNQSNLAASSQHLFGNRECLLVATPHKVSVSEDGELATISKIRSILAPFKRKILW